MPLTCIIVDDEQHAIDVLRHYLGKTASLELVFATTHPLEALDLLRERKGRGLGVDVVFLDIHMPQVSGLEFLQIVGSSCRFILTTAYSDYALAGFEHQVVDYLLKPIAFERFLKAVQRLHDLTQKSAEVKEAPGGPAVADFLLVKTESKGKLIKINVGDIVYVEGLKNYVSIYTRTERIVTLLTLKDLAEQLPPGLFFRVHKSYLVAVDCIHTIDGNQVFLQSPQPKPVSIPLGATYRESFLTFLESHRRNK